MTPPCTPSQAAKELLQRRAARQSLIAFTEYTNSAYQAAPHHRLIADKLEAVERGEIKRLMIFMPPRHGKSELASRRFPAWAMGRNPMRQVIAASYNSDLASDFGREVRNIIATQEYRNVFPDVTLAADSQSANRWHAAQGGGYVAAGVGTAITGRGADILLIDDPVKDQEEADSVIVQQRTWDWYRSTAYTRLMPGGAIVLIQTRWNVADLAGRILDAKVEDWDIVSLPALSGDQPLWPERYPRKDLETTRAVLGTRQWSALYQQSPMPAGGGEFKREWQRTYREHDGGGLTKYLLVDPAGRKGSDNDYTSMWVVGLSSDSNYYVLDAIRDRLNLTQRADAVFRLHRRWKPYEVRYERYGMMGDIEHINDRQERENYRFHITEVAGLVPKETRIRRLVPLFEAKRFYFPPFIHYTDSDNILRDMVHSFVEEEMLAFPAGAHDDMLDALARIAEPDLSLVWPTQEEPKPERYAYKAKGSAWAA